MQSISTKIKNLPDSPGIYRFKNENDEIIYIGKAKSLKKRVSSYFSFKNHIGKTRLMISQIHSIETVKVFSEFEAQLLEAEEIKKNQPFFNIQSKDDKSPLYIKIAAGDVPLITTARNEKPKKGVFIKGPFTSASAAKDILKIIRKIFPYCHHKNPKKPCLYVHLGLCPYPYSSKSAAKSYRENTAKIKKLLQGKTQYVINSLKKEMSQKAKGEKFEQAHEIKKRIEKLEFLTTTYHAPKEFLQVPTLVDDLTHQKLKKLQNVLNLKKVPKRIECYDISNIQGKLATGSMVVFTSGTKTKGEYRKFKIKFSNKPNDYEMIKEVLIRRFKNNWPSPDLLVIDGGKGHLNTAQNVINKLKLNIKVISIAKRLEEVYVPDKVLPISLPKTDIARQLIQEIRDEAHRFAITYHRLLRSKQLLGKL